MESQTIEYKQQWDDKYLAYISGFANAQGGTIYVGINDKGEVRLRGDDYKDPICGQQEIREESRRDGIL